MQYTILGKTGLKVSRIGFGGIPIQRIEKSDAPALLRAVRDAGINYIDSAKAYTVSEEWIGDAIKGMRNNFILASKSMSRTKEAMAHDIDTSLEKFQTDYIDLYQVHNCPPDQLEQVLAPGGALEALMEARKAGKIGHIGITAHSLETFRSALDMDWVETIMFPYNVVETQAEALIAECRKKNIGFLAMKPLAGGAIEDGSLAMRFVLANPSVTMSLAGMYSPDEVRQNAAAADDTAPLTDEELTEMKAIRERLGENFCRRCNYCAPCSVGIAIPNVFLFEGYLSRYGLEKWARDRYGSMKVKASACIGCGLCETRCPYHLPIREMLKKAAHEFGE